MIPPTKGAKLPNVHWDDYLKKHILQSLFEKIAYCHLMKKTIKLCKFFQKKTSLLAVWMFCFQNSPW